MMDEIPGNIKALDNNKIAVRGFMLPVKLEDGLVTEFFLMKTQGALLLRAADSNQRTA